MKNFIIFLVIILFSLIILIVLLFFIIFGHNLKYYNWKMVGLPGHSLSIEESKEKGAYICEITCSEQIIVINDSTKLKINGGWLEKTWIYPFLFKELTFENRIEHNRHKPRPALGEVLWVDFYYSKIV